MSDPNPCPWCRSKRPELRGLYNFSVLVGWRVDCIKCDARGPAKLSERGAIAAWNRVARPAKEKT